MIMHHASLLVPGSWYLVLIPGACVYVWHTLISTWKKQPLSTLQLPVVYPRTIQPLTQELWQLSSRQMQNKLYRRRYSVKSSWRCGIKNILRSIVLPVQDGTSGRFIITTVWFFLTSENVDIKSKTRIHHTSRLLRSAVLGHLCSYVDRRWKPGQIDRIYLDHNEQQLLVHPDKRITFPLELGSDSFYEYERLGPQLDRISSIDIRLAVQG
jgi:hypothetical protein